MTNSNTNQELTPAEAMHALADGETLTRRGRRSRVTPDGYLVVRGKRGEQIHEVALTGWCRLPKERDVGTDPKVGDVVVMFSSGRYTVLYTDAKYVLCERGDAISVYPFTCSREDWIVRCEKAESVERVVGASTA